MIAWVGFLACVAAITVAGTVLVREGERISALTGISQGAIGFVLLAVATSLPELLTGMSAILVEDAPDIAVGDILGSCLFNLALFAVLNLVANRGDVYARLGREHLAAAILGIAALMVIGGALIARWDGLSAAHVGVESLLIGALYALAIRLGTRQPIREHPRSEPDRAALTRAMSRYGVAAIVVVIAGVALPGMGTEIARQTGWGETFVGTMLVAAATSMPELIVTIQASRTGAFAMAAGNLLGSNLFNFVILALDDAVFLRGPLLAHAAPWHVVTAAGAIAMTVLVAAALLRPPTRGLLGPLAWPSILLALLYLGASYGLFALSAT
ncbi:MAG: sodium:calcium antiporter [Alphaproteobacteria bacterium]|nr:sodium:calcium antiporter [Alphaproteobacteria bacterium]